MSSPTPTEPAYDVVVIGAGPAGEVTAARAVRGGLSAVPIPSYPTTSELWLRLLEAFDL